MTPADIYYERKDRCAQPTAGEAERMSHLSSLIRRFEKVAPGVRLEYYNRVLDDELLAGQKCVNQDDPRLADGSVTLRELELRKAIGSLMRWMTEADCL